MRCSAILAIVFAFSADCLAQNIEVIRQYPPSDDGPRLNLPGPLRSKISDSNGRTVLTFDEILSLAEVVKVLRSSESGQFNGRSGGNNLVNGVILPASYRTDLRSRKGRGRRPPRPKAPKAPKVPQAPKVPEVPNVPKVPKINQNTTDAIIDLVDSAITKLQESQAPLERRIPVNPPPIEPRVRISLPSGGGKEPRKVAPTSGPRRVAAPQIDKDEWPKYRSQKPQGGDPIFYLRSMISKTDNMKVKSLLNSLIQEQTGGPRQIKTLNDGGNTSKKLDPPRRIGSKGPTKTKLVSEDDGNDFEPKLTSQYIPRRVRSKVIHEDANINKNININTNGERDKSKILRSSSRRALSSGRPHRHHHHHQDKNENINSNINTIDDSLLQSTARFDELIPMRRSLDHSIEDNINSNTNINRNSNINRQFEHQNKHRLRELRRLV